MGRRQRGSATRGGTGGRVRIIAGEWRGRQLPVHDRDGLRPTGDRLRETLFNWLAPYVSRARCLDLFAGSGALGIEALSRGAAHCDFVDNGAAIAHDLREQLRALGAGERAAVHAADAFLFLDDAGRGGTEARDWDIIFVDPPFAADLATAALASLVSGAHLVPGSLVYLENARHAEPQLPDDLVVLKEGGSGAVAIRLLEFVGTGASRTAPASVTGLNGAPE